jgi:ATP-binding cassette subfamily C protein LapB
VHIFAKLPKANVAVASLALNLLSLALPVFILQVYDRIIPNKAESTAFLLALGVLLAIGLELLLKIGRTRILGRRLITQRTTASRQPV